MLMMGSAMKPNRNIAMMKTVTVRMIWATVNEILASAKNSCYGTVKYLTDR